MLLPVDFKTLWVDYKHCLWCFWSDIKSIWYSLYLYLPKMRYSSFSLKICFHIASTENSFSSFLHSICPTALFYFTLLYFILNFSSSWLRIDIFRHRLLCHSNLSLSFLQCWDVVTVDFFWLSCSPKKVIPQILGELFWSQAA